MAAPRVSAIVPTLGKSPWLGDCLRALDRAGGSDLELILVDQTEPGSEAGLDDAPRALQRLRPGTRPLGFAAANNLALATAGGALVALVNDDAVVAEDWLERLVAAFDDDNGLGAVQGSNLQMAAPARIDGRGMAWNRWWQAVQIDRGGAVERDAAAIDVFGVSATAAVYRRAALAAACGDGFGTPFDARLESYYEDVDLAVRLQAAGWRARSIAGAIARHAGGATGSALPQAGRALICGNRLLVLARMLGRGFWAQLPRILLRDLADLWQARRRRDAAAAAGIARGLRRAIYLLPRFARAGPALVPRATLRRFTTDPPR